MAGSSSSTCLIHSHVDNSHSHSHSHSCCCCSTYPAAWDWDWDLHNLPLFNSSHFSSLVHNCDRLECAAMESMIRTTTTPPYFSTTLGCDSSSGYLEDVLIEYGNYSTKRRRLLYDDDPPLLQQDSTYMWPSFQSLINDDTITSNIGGLSTCTSSEESRSRLGSVEEISSMVFPETTQSPKEASWALEDAFDHCSSSSVIDMMSRPKYTYCDDDDKFRVFSMTCQESDESRMGMKKKSRIINKVVYPFALVKPGGEEGEITLKDINERMLMRPSRPIRHPVGDFACRPCVSKPHGPGLSGKAVVALTRIRTLGRGTVTIIRTKG